MGFAQCLMLPNIFRFTDTATQAAMTASVNLHLRTFEPHNQNKALLLLQMVTYSVTDGWHFLTEVMTCDDCPFHGESCCCCCCCFSKCECEIWDKEEGVSDLMPHFLPVIWMRLCAHTHTHRDAHTHFFNLYKTRVCSLLHTFTPGSCSVQQVGIKCLGQGHLSAALFLTFPA